MVISNTIQPVKLFYEHNLVTETIAYIFVNEECKTLTYKDAKSRAE